MKLKEIKEKVFNNKKWIVFAICVLIVIILIKSIFANEILGMDKALYGFMKKYLICDSFTPIVKFITSFGGVIFTCLLMALILIFSKSKYFKYTMFANLSIATFLNLLLKSIVKRPRPLEWKIIEEKGYSFPSGHSMISAAFYGLIIYFIYNNVENKKLKWKSIILLNLLILLIGLSRIYLGVHYASDVLAGFLVSISYLIIFTRFI